MLPVKQVEQPWCSSHLAQCVCNLPYGHEGDHECLCGGAWDRDGQPTVWPGRRTYEQAVTEWRDTWTPWWACTDA